MKYLASVIILLVINSGFSQSKIIKTKYFESDEYSFKYPKSWKIHDNHGELAISPKYYMRNGRNYFNNILTFYKFDSDKYAIKTVDEAIQSIIDLQSKWDGDTKFVLTKDRDLNGELHVIELKNNSAKWPQRSLIYIYDHSSGIYGIKYNVETDKYDNYIEEAMIIFDSFRIIN